MTSIPKKPLDLRVHHKFQDRNGEDWYVWEDTAVRPYMADIYAEMKRFGDVELAAETWAAQCNRRVRNYDPTQDIPGVTWEWEHNIMARFATLPHYDEAGA